MLGQAGTLNGMTSTFSRRNWIVSGILFFVCQVLFLINIQFPRGFDFDEFHYVPSAKQYLELKTNQNWEHPPLGKLIMAVSIAVGGDRPFGWRLLSTTFGAATLVAMYLWCIALFRNEELAIWAVLVTLCNNLLYVQARIGMLDTFMMAFIAWALVGFTVAWDPLLDPKSTRRWLAFCGLMLGLATATKWFGVIPWVTCVGLILVIRAAQRWGVSLAATAPDDFYHPDLFRGVTAGQLLRYFFAYPLLAYFLTFIPLFLVPGHHTFWELFTMQARMWDGQQRVVTHHPYMSTWLEWPTLYRPIWYAFDKEGDRQEWVRGVLCIGNPLVMLSGLLAIALCLWGWFTTRKRDAFLISVFYFAFFLCWAFIPRKIAFYYYYYPAGMVLSMALAYVFHYGERGAGLKGHLPRWLFLGGTVALFCYFFPVLAALRIPANSFRHWTWFTSWI
jgi:dolichyl-phosphate-mannose--protein O-mannosyl transferase